MRRRMAPSSSRLREPRTDQADGRPHACEPQEDMVQSEGHVRAYLPKYFNLNCPDASVLIVKRLLTAANYRS